MKRIATSLITAVALWLTLKPVTAQQSALTNDSIVQMVKAGLAEDQVVGLIESMPGRYVVTPESFRALKAEGVTDRMLGAVVSKVTESGGPVLPDAARAAEPVAARDPNDPSSPHDPGVWLVSGRGGVRRMTVLKPASFKQSKSGGSVAAALTYGIAQQKTKDVIMGRAAGIRTDSNPEFYLYFADNSRPVNRFGGTDDDANLKQVSLVRTSPTGSTREITTNAVNVFGSSAATNGVLDKEQIAFRYERIREGVYKVTVERALRPGEYCFRFAGSGIFDFGVD